MIEMLDLVYSSNAEQAWRLLDEAWPADRQKKEAFRASFLTQLSTSPYWDVLCEMNGTALTGVSPSNDSSSSSRTTAKSSDREHFNTLEELMGLSDIIVKAEATATGRREGGMPHEFETELRVISTLKGEPGGERIRYRHVCVYPMSEGSPFLSVDVIGRVPANNTLQQGRSYIVFAAATEEPGVYTQVEYKMVVTRNLEESPAVVLAANDSPVDAGKTVQEIIWDELTGLLKSVNPDDVLYAITHFDPEERRDPSPQTTFFGFSRHRVVKALEPLLEDANAKIALEAIREIGRDSPYMPPLPDPFLYTDKGPPGMSDYNLVPEGQRPPFVNVGGQYCREALCAVANGSVPAAGTRTPEAVNLRRLAVLALARTGEPEVFEQVKVWVTDPEPEIRAAAARLLEDFPSGESSAMIDRLAGDENETVRTTALRVAGTTSGVCSPAMLVKLANDADPGVRATAAMVAGASQPPEMLPPLIAMLSESDRRARLSAANNLLKYPMDDIRPTLLAHRDDPDFGVEFTFALATENPEMYLDWLMGNIESGRERPLMTAFKSWNILLKYLHTLDDTALNSPETARMLDVLESMENIAWIKLWVDLVNLYNKRGITERTNSLAEKILNSLPPELRKALEISGAGTGSGR